MVAASMSSSLGLFSIPTFHVTETHSPSLITLRPHAPPPSSVKLPVMRKVKTLATVSPPPPPPPPPGKTRGIMKPRRVSPEMQELIGLPEISRTQALKHIWAYIKQNNLQDPENKKVIICDEKLKKVFAGRDQVGMLEIAGLISPHFLK
ncbi:hypothetical protein TanjilG_15397 [Lupinus angustifolius]|uniref:DM2 domain-containing protein n=1 Tax=Lupinus angustifolius TaxID=3871 RepID=A0A1J7HJX3_LUPAN|nr:PREDICTED: uncharacterized protein LOC109346329 [Lupinus angustifolius]XP_019444512.1 PREDICTED: uncharacterized protein LOC109348522 [Lupinus angustifolius]OIW11184.1 hypothetical protein TanjilG_22991 [Lupinus angustifolius]OIW12948.1 hypothetical protein TanjilG_15397 [Lupinus angustifolius]